MPNDEINPETILSTTEKPLTLLRWLRAIQKTNAQITEKLTELENTLNGKVAKAGDTMTGDLSVPNINVGANANVGKLNSEKLNQKYEGAIKSELHVDQDGIVEFVNGSNAGRFDTARVIKPSEVKTEIYDNQEGKRMFFRLPYLEASAGEHRLLTEEDLGGSGLEIERVTLTNSTQSYNATINIDIVNDYFAVIDFKFTNSRALSDLTFDFTMTAEQKATLINVLVNNRQYLTEYTNRISSTDSDLINGCDISLISYLNYLRVHLHGELPANGNCEIHEVFSK